MTCAEFKKFVEGPGLIPDRSRTEQIAIMRHYTQCRACRRWTVRLSKEANAEEIRQAEQDVDKLTPALQRALETDPEI